MAVGGSEFVDSTIGYGTGLGSPSSEGVFAPNVWSKRVIVALQNNLVFGEAVDRRYESDAKVGKSVRVASISNLNARTKSENTPITYETNSETVTAIDLTSWIYAAFGIESIAELQNHVDVRKYYQAKLGYALSKKIDDDVAGLVTGLSQSVGTLGTVLTDDDYLEAVRLLDSVNVPRDSRVVIVSPSEHINLLKSERWTNRDYVDWGTVSKGKVPKLYEMPLLVTTNVNQPSTNQAACVMMHKEAFALVVQQDPKSHLFYDMDLFAWKLATECVYGKAEMRDDHGIYLKGKF